MLRLSGLARAPVFCRIVDMMREKDPFTRPGILYPIRIELGEGVNKMSIDEFQTMLDLKFNRSTRYASVKTGHIYTRRGSEAREIVAYGQYVVTGNMRGGYIKPDHRYGPRLTGYGGATTKPGLKWNGDDL